MAYPKEIEWKNKRHGGGSIFIESNRTEKEMMSREYNDDVRQDKVRPGVLSVAAADGFTHGRRNQRHLSLRIRSAQQFRKSRAASARALAGSALVLRWPQACGDSCTRDLGSVREISNFTY